MNPARVLSAMLILANLAACEPIDETSILGTWEETGTAQVQGSTVTTTATYTFGGASPEQGTATLALRIHSEPSRCTFRIDGAGTFRVTGDQLNVSFSGGSTQVTGCADPANDQPRETVDAAGIDVFGTLRGRFVMDDAELTVTPASGDPVRVFLRM